MRKSKAFTLVELLVVIAITMLMVAVLLPSLVAAKDFSKLTKCKAHLHTLIKATTLYAELNSGYMMVYRHSFVTYEGTKYIQGPWQGAGEARAFSGPLGGPGLLMNGVHNLGLLYAGGLLMHPETFYCPGTMRDRRYRLDNYPKPWGSQTGPGSSWIRTGYMWNPWIEILGGQMESPDTTFEDGLVFARHPGERHLISDLIFKLDTTGHRTTRGAYWNLAYPDGHAESFECQLIYGMFLIGLDVGATWNDYQRYIRPYLPGN